MNNAATLTPTAPAKEAPFDPMTSIDRCDAGTKDGVSCNAQAWARVILPSGLKLLFCGHHMHDHHDELIKTGATVEDYTDKIPQ